MFFHFHCSQLLNKLYLDTATTVWNGNPLEGSEAILKFLDQLPTTEHTIESLDCQPIPGIVYLIPNQHLQN